MYMIIHHGENPTLGQIQHAAKHEGELSFLLQPHNEPGQKWSSQWVMFRLCGAAPTCGTVENPSIVCLKLESQSALIPQDGQFTALYDVQYRAGVGLYKEY